MKIAATLLSLLLPFAIFAQFSYKSGYVVRNNGDTARGFLKEDDEARLSKGVAFAKSSSGEGGVNYTLADIKHFAFDGGNAYEKIHAVDFDNTVTDVFAQALLSGYYRLFAFKASTHQYFAVKTAEDSTYLLYDDQQSVNGTLDKEGNFKNVLNFLSAGCDDVKGRLTNISYSEREMEGYVQALNKCKAPSTASNILTVKPKSILRIYVFAGGMATGKGNNEITGRAALRITTPALDKRSSINIGISYFNYSKLEHKEPTYELPYSATSTLKEQMIQIPFTIQYNFFNGIVQPYINAGPSLVFQNTTGGFDESGFTAQPKKAFGVGITGAIGVECPITPNLLIKADWTYELLTHYPVVGVSLRF